VLVTSAISKLMISGGAGDDIGVAEKFMREKQVHRLMVDDTKGHPVGLISPDDIARTRRDTEIAQTLASLRSTPPSHRGERRLMHTSPENQRLGHVRTN
jgi:CBS domain